ncbi:MAG TPA: YciI family protein [Parvibaculum sp.]
MLFCITGIDKADSLPLRLANREAHLKYWADTKSAKIGGPFTSEDGSVLRGSMLIVEAASLAAAQKLATDDPYAIAGLFERHEVRPWKWLLGQPA